MPTRTQVGQGRGLPDPEGGRGPQPSVPPRAPPRRGRGGFGLGLLGLVGACLIGFVAGATTGLLAPPDLFGAAEDETGDVATRSVRASTSFFSTFAGSVVQRQLILLLGRDVTYVDGRPAEGVPARSDTMMVLGVDPPRQRLTFMSIPRDTRCDIPGHGKDKINAALALGGPHLAMQTVSNLLDIPIDHFAVVKLDGLIRMVDLIGGVDLEVPESMRYTDRAAGLKIRLKKGFQHLDGQKAHEFVRFRHDSQGDIGRIARQQAFMQAVTKKMLQPETVVALPHLVGALQESIETSIDSAQWLAIAAWAKSLRGDQIRMAMLPGEFSAGMKASYWIIDVARAKRLAARLLLSEAPPAVVSDTPEGRLDVHVAILNGTQRARLASEAARLLRAEGWTVWFIGDADRRDYEGSRIMADAGDDAVAGAIARNLNLGMGLEALPLGTNLKLSREDIDYMVILGQDFIRALRVPMPHGG